MDQTFGSAGAGPLLWKGKDGGREVPRGLAAYLPCAVSDISCPLCLLPHLPLHSLKPPPLTPGHMCGPKLMGCCPRDGLVATFCLSLSTSNKLRPNHHEGMLMRGAPGPHIEMPICGRGQLGARGENEALTPGPLSAWRGDRRGGERPLQPGSPLCFFGSVSLQVCREGCGEKGNASLHHMFSLWLRMWTPVGFKSTKPDLGQIVFAICVFSVTCMEEVVFTVVCHIRNYTRKSSGKRIWKSIKCTFWWFIPSINMHLVSGPDYIHAWLIKMCVQNTNGMTTFFC